MFSKALKCQQIFIMIYLQTLQLRITTSIHTSFWQPKKHLTHQGSIQDFGSRGGQMKNVEGQRPRMHAPKVHTKLGGGGGPGACPPELFLYLWA